MAEGDVTVELRDASLEDIEEQLAELESAHRLYEAVRGHHADAPDVTISYEMQVNGETAGNQHLTTEQLHRDASRYRILAGIRDEVKERARDQSASFGLHFDLSCKASTAE